MLAGLDHIEGMSAAHLVDETVTNNVMAMVRRLAVAVTVLSQRGSRSTSSLISRAFSRTLERSSEISFCPE